MQRTQSDFVKHMASIDEKLQEAKKKIAELEGGLNFTVKKSKPKAEESRSKPQTFNGEYVSWMASYQLSGDNAVDTKALS